MELSRNSADGIRTHTLEILSLLALPVGLLRHMDEYLNIDTHRGIKISMAPVNPVNIGF